MEYRDLIKDRLRAVLEFIGVENAELDAVQEHKIIEVVGGGTEMPTPKQQQIILSIIGSTPFQLTAEQQDILLGLLGKKSDEVEPFMRDLSRHLTIHRKDYMATRAATAKSERAKIQKAYQHLMAARIALEELDIMSTGLLFRAYEERGVDEPQVNFDLHRSSLDEMTQVCAEASALLVARGNRPRTADISLIYHLAHMCHRYALEVPATSETSRFYQLAKAILNIAGSSVSYPMKTIRPAVQRFNEFMDGCRSRHSLK